MYEKELKAFGEYLIMKRFRNETIKSYKRVIKLFLTQVNKQPEHITPKDITRYESTCKRYSNNSLTPIYSAINKYMQFLREEGIQKLTRDELEDMKLKPPKQEKKIKQPLTDEQVEKIFKEAEKNPMHRAMFMTFYYGMLRRSEIIKLNLENIHYDRKKLDVLDAKGGVDATINLTQRCIDTLKDYVDKHRGKPLQGHEHAVFLLEGRRLSKTKVYEINRMYKYKAKLPDDFKFNTHLWRVSGVTHYARNEKDIKKLMSQTRHKDPSVLMGYINYTDKEITNSYMNAFDRPQKPKPTKPDVIETTLQQPQITPTVQSLSKNEDIKQQLVQRLARGEISQEVYLIAIKSLESENKETVNYYQ